MALVPPMEPPATTLVKRRAMHSQFCGLKHIVVQAMRRFCHSPNGKNLDVSMIGIILLGNVLDLNCFERVVFFQKEFRYDYRP